MEQPAGVIRHFTEIFEITSEDVIGNQAPFDFDVSVKDIYSSIMTGAQLVLIPKEYFSTPPRLLDYLCDKKVTNLTWAVSALTLVSALKGLNYRVPESVKRVMFSGEAMPAKQLRIWQEKLPEAKFVNLLWSRQRLLATVRIFRLSDSTRTVRKYRPVRHSRERRVILVDEEGKQVTEPGVQGEICSAGESLANGYYKEPEQTAEKFVLYPVDGTEQRMYRTGDLGSYDEGNIVFAGRKDFQIKHMGHRIELEEIERSMTALDGVEKSCCVFNTEKNRIMGFYLGEPSGLRCQKTDEGTTSGLYGSDKIDSGR